jgi:DNA-binding transcriptional ArsR family regulator|tara:strand:+ start:5654 stop:6049 length:396 start_codon:yes stop_codon:yes gene_type:complete
MISVETQENAVIDLQGEVELETRPDESIVDLQTMQVQAKQAARLMKALSNESRLMILCMLVEGELSVSQLNERIPLSQSALSQHLAWLRKDHLVACRRDAQTIYYQLQGDKAQRVLQVLHDLYCPTDNEPA